MVDQHDDNLRPEDAAWRNIKETGRLGRRRVLLLDTTDSTNNAAMALGIAGEPAGTIVAAETQTSGRGRLGRVWQSPAGTGLYFSIILKPQLDAADLAKITLAAGVAACKAVEDETSLSPLIKWPNDLMLGNKKFGGILTETGAIKEKGATLVILGIGVNVATTMQMLPEELQDKATSLALETGIFFRRGELLAAMVGQIEAAVMKLEGGRFSAILQEFEQRDAIKGLQLRWLTPAGQIVTGVSVGLDRDGTLHIRDDEGQVHQVLSGDVTFSA